VPSTEGTDLTQYSEKFDAALEKLSSTDNKYTNYDYRFVTKKVSAWRENDDYFDLMYDYFYNLEDADKKDAAINVLKDLALPGELEDLYVSLFDSIRLTSAFAQMQSIDTTEFMVLFKNSYEYMEEFAALEDGSMIKDLYENLKFKGILQQGNQSIEVTFAELYDFVRTTKNGYLYQMSAMLGTDIYSKIWEPYIAIITNEEEGYLESEKYGEDVEALFNAYVALSPTEQVAFSESLNVFYRYNLQQPVLAWSAEDGVAYSTFSMIIINHYRETLGEDLYPIYQNLIEAMEQYAVRFKYEKVNAATWDDKFYEVKSAYDLLEEGSEEKALFDEKLGALYTKYLGFYEMSFVELDETWKARFDELGKAYVTVYDAYIAIMGDAQNGIASKNEYALFFSGYLKAQELAAAILNGATDDVKNVYYYQGYEINDGWIQYSMDYWALTFKSIYMDFMLNYSLRTTSGNSIILWDVFNTETYEMNEFYLSIYDLVFGYKNSAKGGFDELTNEEVLAILDAYQNLTVAQKTLFSYFDDYYQMAVKAYYDQLFTSTAAKALAQSLWSVSDKYFNYVNHVETTEKEEDIDPEIQKAFEDEFKALQTKLSTTETTAQDEFNGKLSTVYNFFKTAYDALQVVEDETQEGTTGTQE
jgi:hypothetical protein